MVLFWIFTSFWFGIFSFRSWSIFSKKSPCSLLMVATIFHILVCCEWGNLSVRFWSNLSFVSFMLVGYPNVSSTLFPPGFMCDAGAILVCLFRVSPSVLWTVGEKALMFLVTLAINQRSYIKSSAQLHGGTSLWSIPLLKWLQWIPFISIISHPYLASVSPT